MILRELGLPLAVATAVSVATARADPAPTVDSSGAPLPGQENGGVDTSTPPDGTGRILARDLLLVPKLLFELVQLPLRAGVYVFDRYQLEDLYERTFYNRHRTFGIVPTAMFQTGTPLLAGATMVMTDALGEREHATFEALYGGPYGDVLWGWMDTGQRLGRLVLRVDGDFLRRPADPFYGIGNADVGARPRTLVDPLTSGVAFPSYLRYQELRGALKADVRVFDGLHVVASTAFARLDFADSTNAPGVTSVYDAVDLVGFEHGYEHVDGSLELRLDRRRSASELETTSYGTGWMASAFATHAHRVDAVLPPSEGLGAGNFTRYGADVEGFIHLGVGPRLLVLRALAEGVTGNLDQVPFVELPWLGGDFLRGYTFERFRDRVAAVGTAQYVWDLTHNADAYVFVDAGRVYSGLDALTADHLRVGYGIGLAAYGDRNFMFEGYIASSIDGGVFVSAAFVPLLDQRPRWEGVTNKP